MPLKGPDKQDHHARYRDYFSDGSMNRQFWSTFLTFSNFSEYGYSVAGMILCTKGYGGGRRRDFFFLFDAFRICFFFGDIKYIKYFSSFQKEHFLRDLHISLAS
jgi:hypothetical protein